MISTVCFQVSTVISSWWALGYPGMQASALGITILRSSTVGALQEPWPPALHGADVDKEKITEHREKSETHIPQPRESSY